MNRPLGALLFWISVAVCAIAELAIVAATARASRRGAGTGASFGDAGDRPQVEGARALPATHRWLEVLYAAAPAVVLALLLVATWRAMHGPLPTPHSLPDTSSIAGPVITR